MTTADAALEFLREHNRGVLATLKRDGRPQLSNIVYGVLDGKARISVTDRRAKARNLRRDPRASLHVTDEQFGRYVVIEGTAVLTDVTVRPDDDAAELLVRTYRAIAGEHPDWDEYRQAMIDQERLVISVTIEHAYGQGI